MRSTKLVGRTRRNGGAGGDARYAIGIGDRTADHGQGLYAVIAFCFVLYFICYLDRVNIGFAALTMNNKLGLSSYVFGLGAGAFFWGYFILEVPSNLILEKVGARRWIAANPIFCSVATRTPTPLRTALVAGDDLCLRQLTGEALLPRLSPL
jgi:hypothetical protein